MLRCKHSDETKRTYHQQQRPTAAELRSKFLRIQSNHPRYLTETISPEIFRRKDQTSPKLYRLSRIDKFQNKQKTTSKKIK